jgi:predicted phage terminase large subunit-like protein
MVRPVPATLTKKEFLKFVADTAADLQRTIEAEVDGLDPDPSAILARRDLVLASDGFEYFCRTYFPHYVKSPHLSALHVHLFRRLPEILHDSKGCTDAIAAPRGEAKSTYCTQLGTLWAIVCGLTHYTIIGMDAFEQAAVMLEAIKAELEFNPRLLMDFPEICGKGRVWKEGVAVTASDVKVEAVGARQKIRGRRHGPHRPDLVFLDDIENDENVKTPEQRDKLDGWVDKAVLNLGAADGSINVLFIGTILHYDSVLSRKLRNPLWRGVKFRSVIRWPDRMDLWERWEQELRNEGEAAADAFFAANREAMLAGAQVSWPGVRPFPALMRLRIKIGTAAFDSEQQNDPVSESDSLFPTPLFWVERLSQWIFFGACDPSLGRSNKGRDPSAVLVGGISKETGILDVVEASIRRRLPDRIIEDVIDLQAVYPCVKWGVESVQFQEFFRTEMVKRSALRGLPVPAVPIIPGTDKALRIERLQPHVANGLIRLHPSQTQLLEQMRHWPMVDHDDGLDALEMLWVIAIGGLRPSAGATIADGVQDDDQQLMGLGAIGRRIAERIGFRRRGA